MERHNNLYKTANFNFVIINNKKPYFINPFLYIFSMTKPRSSLKSHLNAKERHLHKELGF